MLSLSSTWKKERVLEAFFSGGKIAYCEATEEVFCLCAEEVHVVAPFQGRLGETGGAPRHFGVEGDGILTFDVSKDGKMVLCACKSTLLRRWDRDAKGKGQGKGDDEVQATGDGDAGEAPASPWKNAKSWRATNTFVIALALSHTGSLAVSGSTDANVRVWDTRGGFCTHSFSGHSGAVTAVQFHPRRRVLVVFSGGEDGVVKAWDLKTSRQLLNLKDHVASICQFSFRISPDVSGAADDEDEEEGAEEDVDVLAVLGRDRVVSVWSLDTGKQISQVPVFEDCEGLMVVEDEDWAEFAVGENMMKKRKTKGGVLSSFLLVTAGSEGKLKVWDPSTRTLTKAFSTPHASKGAMSALIGCPSSSRPTGFLSVGVDLTLAFWSVDPRGRGLRVDRHLVGYAQDFLQAQLFPAPVPKAQKQQQNEQKEGRGSEKLLAAVLTSDESLRLVDLSPNGGCDSVSLGGHQKTVLCCDVSPNGEWAVTGGKDEVVRLWSLKLLACVAECKGHTGPIAAVALLRQAASYPPVSPRNSIRLVSVSQDKTVKAWTVFLPSALAACLRDLSTEQQKPEEAKKKNKSRQSGSGRAGVFHMMQGQAFSATGRRGGEGADRISDSLGGAVVVTSSDFTLVAHQRDVNHVAVSPNDKLIATSGQDKVARLWSLADGSAQGECKGHTRGVWASAFSPADKVLATASGDTTVKLWNLRQFACPCMKTLQGHSHAVLRVGFLPGGLQVVSAGGDGLVRLWNVRTSDCVFVMDGHDEKIWDLSVKGDRVVSGGGDGRLTLWADVSEEAAAEEAKKKAETLQKETRIQALMKKGKGAKAFRLAVDLQRPATALSILEQLASGRVVKVIEDREAAQTKLDLGDVLVSNANGVAVPSDSEDKDKEESGAGRGEKSSTFPGPPPCWNGRLDSVVKSLSEEQLERVVRFAVEWNTNGRHAWIAHSVLFAVLSVRGSEELMKIEGSNALIQSCLFYSERHLQRLQLLLQKAYLLDLATQLPSGDDEEMLMLGGLGGGDGEEDDDFGGGSPSSLRPFGGGLRGLERASAFTNRVLLGEGEADEEEEEERSEEDGEEEEEEGGDEDEDEEEEEEDDDVVMEAQEEDEDDE
uniref:U3 small nucleolar RNA-associated protein 13 C-terminal domain-containing protein n=1 Tax=Chromera velia CCMP2878 TaxID=1169474 RepID=A0A0G4HPM7_9ALVE|eukprot:Cvel_29858.t1-p1 / transcript=Cvel_29858.t1 / gene=Cvel_29858 / organism=Chromera_velia_CCMP2878 / gene_product=Transducin beta-like protein 3, putative / transcript_product=Transducin beta-like protein 3, putative / location=Cvel_scaffold4165:3564-10524(-) / protein_length=1100 / sequence_SO=supercontig / SO=protein_coding / is_pseudo=false